MLMMHPGQGLVLAHTPAPANRDVARSWHKRVSATVSCQGTPAALLQTPGKRYHSAQHAAGKHTDMGEASNAIHPACCLRSTLAWVRLPTLSLGRQAATLPVPRDDNNMLHYSGGRVRGLCSYIGAHE